MLKNSIRSVSKKRSSQLREYKKLKDEYIREHPTCECQLPMCTGASTELHHKIGRQNARLTDTGFFLAICHPCHMWITEHSREAIDRGFSIERYKK